MANFQLQFSFKLLTNQIRSGCVGICIFNHSATLVWESMFGHQTMSLPCLKSFCWLQMSIRSIPNTWPWPLGPLRPPQHSGFICSFQPHTPHCRGTKVPTISPKSHVYSLPSVFAHSVPSLWNTLPLPTNLSFLGTSTISARLSLRGSLLWPLLSAPGLGHLL